jgi:hypothetical protein
MAAKSKSIKEMDRLVTRRELIRTLDLYHKLNRPWYVKLWRRLRGDRAAS